MSQIPADHITPYILAGGKSSRFGSDKRLLVVHGHPLIENMAALVQKALDKNPVFVGDDPIEIELFDALWIQDAEKESGPVGGLISVLRHARTEWALVLAVDLPGLELTDLNALLSVDPGDAEMIGIGLDDRPEHLIALYRTSTLPIWENFFSSGKRALHQGLLQLKTKTVSPVSGRKALLNLNRPEDISGL